MSAQAGMWNFDGKPVDQGFLRKLGSAIEQYGPDGVNSYIDGSIGMVYRAFHTTKESRLEHQPQKSARGNLVTWDGRLDNRHSLLGELCSDLVDEQSDVAIVSAAYDRWGADCFRKLIGDWALCIWDVHEQTLILARDYLGVRHLYYYTRDKGILWSTDLASLVLLSDGAFTLNDEYIAGFLALYPEAHLTPYREIHSVPPGTIVRIHERKVTSYSYWSFDPNRRVYYKTDAEYEEHFRDVFSQAVRRRLRSDSPILAELSGGLDSSSIVCVADHIKATEEIETPRVDTVSHYNFSEPDGDDFFYFTKVEERRGRKGFHVDVGKYGVSFSLDSPTFSIVPSLAWGKELEAERIALMERGGYRIILSGLGGDEFLGGVPDPRPLLADLIIQLRFRELGRQLVAWSLVKGRPLIALLCESIVLLLPFGLRALFEERARVDAWIDSRFARRHSFGNLKLGTSEGFGFRLPSFREYARTLVMMSWQRTQCQPARGVCVEYRYPFLDQSLIDFLISVPATQLLRPGERRSLMRRALRGLLPPEVWSRRTKATGGKSYMTAVKSNWAGLENILRSLMCSQLGYINRDRFREALLAVKNGTSTDLVGTLRVLFLELWLRNIAERRLISFGSESRRPVGVNFAESEA